MRRGAMRAGVMGAVLTMTAGLLAAAAPESATDEIPPPLAPFEYLIGGWKGTGVPEANKLKGWDEEHVWAWKFAKGQPIGMTVEITGGKTLARGQLTFDPEAEQYRLAGADPAGKAVAFAGKLDATGKILTLDRVGDAASKDKQRLRLQLNGNKIRYTLFDERKETGSPRFAAAITTGLTKKGESFGGTAASDGPKCIVTGGSATASVTYNGKSYPLCCSGCRDEFNDNPEKYVKKMALRLANASKTSKDSSATPGKDDGSFEGLVDEPKSRVKPRAAMTIPRSIRPAAEPAEVKVAPAPAPAATRGKSAVDPSVKAASLLRQAQALEKAGNTRAALGYYRQIVADYPDAPQARTASARVKALGPK